MVSLMRFVLSIFSWRRRASEKSLKRKLFAELPQCNHDSSLPSLACNDDDHNEKTDGEKVVFKKMLPKKEPLSATGETNVLEGLNFQAGDTLNCSE